MGQPLYPQLSHFHNIRTETVQIRELLNMDPQCHDDDKLLAHNVICSFVNHVYNIVNISLSE